MNSTNCSKHNDLNSSAFLSRPSRFSLLRLLLWKNLILRKRHWILTLLELVIPTGLMCLVVFLRTINGSVLMPVPHPQESTFKSASELDLRKVFCYKSFGQWYSSKCQYFDTGSGFERKLYWGPANNFTSSMIQLISDDIFFKESYLQNVSDIAMMDDLVRTSYLQTNSSMERFYMGIYFNSLDSDNDNPPRHLNYDLRFQKIWMTDFIYPFIQIPGPRNYSGKFVASYAMDGFTLLQTIVDRSYMKIVSGREDVVDNVTMETQMYPYPPFVQDHGLSQFYSAVLPTFIVFSLVLLSPILIKSIVYEKETGVRELMRMMGLDGWLIWVGWFCYSFTTIILICAIITGMLKVRVRANDATAALLPPVLAHSDPMLVFFILLLYGVSAICFCFAISSFFNKPIIATTVGVLVWLLSYYIPRTFLSMNYNNISLAPKLLTCIFPNMAMMLIFKVIGLQEGRAIGLHWTNLWETGSPRDEITPGMILIMLTFDIILYILITWYVDQVFPGVYGVARPWNFICQRKRTGTILRNGLQDSFGHRSMYAEKEPEGLEPGIKIRGLRKEFETHNKQVKVAVDNVNLTCYKGQCTVLLGHNGAGKTTTMCVLTGSYAPTDGSAEINGWDIGSHLKEARSQVGLCPQHNTLFTDLTVKEHLMFFARLKGLSIKKAEIEATTLLLRLQLEDKRNDFGGQLSGGMKRKLCLAIALIGGSKTIILDEPSSGLDPESRRWVWDVVQQERGARTVLVTTHHMEEADVLGDRIAIMANGHVVCSGSSLFLKNTFGDGYTLSITGQDGTYLPKVEAVIQSHFEDAFLRSIEGFHFDFKLPPQTERFPNLLNQLTKQKDDLKIDHLGLSLTTLEQVFLRVGELEDNRRSEKENVDLDLVPSVGVVNESFTPDLNTPNNSQNWDMESTYRSDISIGTYREHKLRGGDLLFQRFRSLWMKKFTYSKRKWILLVTQALLPVVVTILSLVVCSIFIEGNSMETPRHLSLSMFEFSNSSMECHGNLHHLATNYTVQFHEPHSVALTDNVTQTLLEASEEDITVYRENYVTSALFREEDGKVVTRVMYQSIPYHTTGVGVNLIDNAVLHTFVDRKRSITTNNAPLPPNTAWQMDDDQTSYGSSYFAMVMPIPLAFLTSSFLVFPQQERASKSKQIQLMTGTPGVLLWLVSYMWDIVTYIVTALLIFICFMTLDSNDYFTVGGAPGALIVLLMLYGISSIPMAYVFSFPFMSAASGFAFLAMVNIIAGMIISTATLALEFAGTETLLLVANIVGNVTAFIPAYPASKGFMSIVDVTNYNNFCEMVSPEMRDDVCQNLHLFVKTSPYLKCCVDYCEEYGKCFEKLSYFQWAYPGGGMFLMFLAIDFFFYLLILCLLEIGLGKLAVVKAWKMIRRIFPVQYTEAEADVDDDVAKERQIAYQLMQEEHLPGTAIVVENLAKVFDKAGVVAVKGISFHVKKGECFGLLGVNGAGKTTTFRMLTGDEVRSSGDARIGTFYLSHGRKQFMEEIGYCPQFDAIINELTGEEMLSLMAGLRGVAMERHSEVLESLITLVDLNECAKRCCGTYSGGNKRKLSTAMALVGQPPLVFLDEPTSGVDPASRRRVWEAVRDATLCGQSVILTSHSMDECEALCSRLVIMAKGVLRCAGTPKHLKMKFGKGYTLQVKIKSSFPRDLAQGDLSEDALEESYKTMVETLKEVVFMCLRGSKLTDEHRGMVVFHVPSTVSWSNIFNVMEALKTGKEDPPEETNKTLWRTKVHKAHLHYLIEDYAAMDPSLEQVFLSFAREEDKTPSHVTMETKL